MKVALHLIHSNSFSTKKSWHIFKFAHRWRTTLIQKKLVRSAKNGVSQEYIGPLILEKIQMYILTRAELLYTLCYEIPCSKREFADALNNENNEQIQYKHRHQKRNFVSWKEDQKLNPVSWESTCQGSGVFSLT